MATTLVLRVFAAPITEHHFALACAEIRTPEMIAEARERIAADQAFATEIAGKVVGSHPLAKLSPPLQFYALAPSLNLGESGDFDSKNPLWDLTQREITLHPDIAEDLIDACGVSPNTKMAAFLAAHRGARAIIQLD